MTKWSSLEEFLGLMGLNLLTEEFVITCHFHWVEAELLTKICLFSSQLCDYKDCSQS